MTPERVERLVLVGSATTPRNLVGIGELVEAVREFDPPHEPVSAEFARASQESTVHAPVPPAFMDAMVAASLVLPARVWRSVLDGMLETDVAAGLADHPRPTLLLWGECDAACPRAEQDALLRLLPGSTPTAYRDTGHAPHWERPEAVAHDLAAFLATPVAGSSAAPRIP